jgi:hypothetical protein
VTAVPRPEGVRILHADGTTTPVELTYRGPVDGLHQWESMSPVEPGDRLHVDTLPPLTTIVFGAEGGDL